MEIVIRGHNLPGRMFRNAGVPIHNVHVAVQERNEPVGLVPADAECAEWTVEVRPRVDKDGALDFGGPAVHGARGERFVYLTWGDLGADGSFAMFRRAKLMLHRVDRPLMQQAVDGQGTLVGTIDLTDERGGPRCARVDPPALTWSLER